MVFPFRPDKKCRFSQLPPLTLNDFGYIKMHEMGEKFKWLQNVGRGDKKKKKEPFVLTELEIAAGVCEDCELRVRLSQDHPP